MNLNTVILLNPRNEEAIYNLAQLKLKKSDYKESKKLIDKLMMFCKNFCGVTFIWTPRLKKYQKSL